VPERLKRRWVPLIGSVAFVFIGMFTTTWGPTHLMGRAEWALPYDLWGTLVAAVRLSHGNIGGIYAAGTGLISLPGAAVILLPCAALSDALGLSLQIPGPHNLHPTVWLVAGPYQMAVSCVVLFAVDALAERLGVSRWKRALLAGGSLGILWSPSPRWGHPEDAVAVGLLLYAILAQSDGKRALAGWLTGCAICVQPLVLLALPVQLALLPWRRMAPFLLRSAAPSVVLLGAAAIANWHDTYLSVTSQPDSPVINHPTVWTSLAPQLAGQNVAAGPFRLATIALACLCALAVRRRWQARVADQHRQPPDTSPAPQAPSRARPGEAGIEDGGGTPFSIDGGGTPFSLGEGLPRAWGGPRGGHPPGGSTAWPAPLLADVLWWVAFALALRSFFEPVMVSYYPWPPMAVALIPAATLSWQRLWAAGLLAGVLTGAAQGPSHAVWIWWVPIVAGLLVLLAISRPVRHREPVAVLTPGGARTRSAGRPVPVPGAWRSGRRPTKSRAGGG
jgi:hypothetical protein